MNKLFYKVDEVNDSTCLTDCPKSGDIKIRSMYCVKCEYFQGDFPQPFERYVLCDYEKPPIKKGTKIQVCTMYEKTEESQLRCKYLYECEALDYNKLGICTNKMIKCKYKIKAEVMDEIS